MAEVFPGTTGGKDGGTVSPDGHWIAYGSPELGGWRVFVQPYPEVGGGRWMVADIAAMEVQWAADNTLYIQASQRIEARPLPVWPDSFSSLRENIEYGLAPGQNTD